MFIYKIVVCGLASIFFLGLGILTLIDCIFCKEVGLFFRTFKAIQTALYFVLVVGVWMG